MEWWCRLTISVKKKEATLQLRINDERLLRINPTRQQFAAPFVHKLAEVVEQEVEDLATTDDREARGQSEETPEETWRIKENSFMMRVGAFLCHIHPLTGNFKPILCQVLPVSPGL